MHCDVNHSSVIEYMQLLTKVNINVPWPTCMALYWTSVHMTDRMTVCVCVCVLSERDCISES